MKANKPIAFLAVALAVALAAAGLVGALAFWAANAFFVRQAELNVENLLLSHRGIHLYVQQVMHPKFYEHQQKGGVPEDFYAPELLSSSFIVREQHQLYNQVRQQAGLEPTYYKMAATNPRNPVNRADEREAALIALFNAQRGLARHSEIVELDGRKYLYVALPFLENTQACLRCHGVRADAPAQLQARYPGEGGFDERVGQIRAVESVRVPIQTETRSAWVAAAALLAGLSALGGLALTNRWLARRVRERTAHLEKETVERERAEEALRVTQFAVDGMADACFRFRADGRFVYVNEAALAQLGYGREELLGGMRVPDVSGRLRTEEWPAIWERIARVGQFTTESIHRRKDGALLPVEVRCTLMRFAGEEFGWAVARDLTDRKKLEGQLLQAQKMEAVGTLAGGIAHDFNNILSAVLGYADLALDSLPQGSECHDDVGQIVVASERARELVRQILAFSRKDQRQKAPLQVGLIAKEALKLLRASLPATIEIRERLDTKAWALADPTGFHQIVMNLCTNAFHAMKEKGGVLELEVAEADVAPEGGPAGVAAGGYVRMRVRDSGVGMDAATRQRIFEPYFSTRQDAGGTGLGLSVVHGLVAGYGGAVTVQSEPGQGATFEVWLPRAAPSEPRSALAAADPPRGTERILFVDDEESMRALTTRMLRSLGYAVTLVETPQEALEKVRETPAGFDLLLTDQTMPKMTGLSLAASARALRPALKVVLMTGYSEAVQGKTPAELGIDKVLLKPFSLDEMAKALRETLGSKA
ncbi:MAG TPA: DUF3365 domain-containing protein [Myxococcales bacterium]